MQKEHKTVVRQSWKNAQPIADMTAELFYRRLFEVEPSIRPLFAKADMIEQRRKLIKTLNAAVDGLDALEVLVPVLEDLGRRHGGYGVRDAHYDAVGKALLWALQQGLGAAWTSRTEEAWAATYGELAGIMRNASKSGPVMIDGKAVYSA